ncbi:M20/M25/M40 family metallo-hydrolase [Streptomyces sp. NPDC005571]|uniref:M20/M25/M40 family metallo-hydrolase n=1 Tax=Streptomyces sp. NPDC005571 TaxID=3156888 RepID=UPI0033AD5FBB
MSSPTLIRRDTADDAPRPAPAAFRERIPALVVLLLLLLTSVAAVWPLQTPDPRPASAAADRFSAQRALADLDDIAAVPHPSGSAAQARVRDHLLDRLREYGTTPRVITRVAAHTMGDIGRVGTVSDIYATVPGSRPSGQVLLMAHYDSVPSGPGAADNGANVATVLEVVRALQDRPGPRNDIGILFTDGEEQGLLGAKAFIDSGAAGDPRRVVAVNLEARGVSGPTVMFQTVGDGLTPAVRASGAQTTALAGEIFRLLRHDTDLTVLGDAGMRGMNFAFFEGAAHYHTSHDSIDQVSPASVQDMGDSALAATRQLAAADLMADAGTETYFSLFGAVLSYPEPLVLPLACLAVLSCALLLLLGRRRGAAPRGAARAAATFPLALAAAATIGLGGWWVLALVRPDFAIGAGLVYRPGHYLLAESGLLIVCVAGWYRWVRRKASPVEATVGVLAWFAVLGLLTAVALPGGSYLFVWPALLGNAAVAAVLRFTSVESPWRQAAAAVPAAALLLPVILLLLPTLGVSLTVAPLVLISLLAALLPGLLEPLPSHRTLTAGMLTVAVTAAGTFGAHAALDGYSSAEPRPVSLGYLLDSDTGKATWLGIGGPEQPVVGVLLTDGRIRLDKRVELLGGVTLHSGKAKVTTVEAPRAEDVSTTPTQEKGVRTVRMRVRLPADAHSVSVYADTSDHQVLGARIDGAAVVGGRNLAPEFGDWRWTATYVAPSPDGMDLSIRARGTGPLRIRIVSVAAGLPAGTGAPVLPADLSWASWPSVAGQTYVVRTFTVPQ